MIIRSAKDLDVYRLAYDLSMDLFRLSNDWPEVEKYSLIGQIRRSSRSVCANLREAWAKRRYEAHFVSKLTDCDGENSETDTWLDYAMDCGYLDKKKHGDFVKQVAQIGGKLGVRIKNPAPFLINK